MTQPAHIPANLFFVGYVLSPRAVVIVVAVVVVGSLFLLCGFNFAWLAPPQARKLGSTLPG